MLTTHLEPPVLLKNKSKMLSTCRCKSRLTGPTSPLVEIQPKQYLFQAFAWLLAGVLKELQQSEVVLPDSHWPPSSMPLLPLLPDVLKFKRHDLVKTNCRRKHILPTLPDQRILFTVIKRNRHLIRCTSSLYRNVSSQFSQRSCNRQRNWIWMRR